MGLLDFFKRKLHVQSAGNQMNNDIESSAVKSKNVQKSIVAVNAEDKSNNYEPISDSEIEILFEQSISSAIPTKNGLYPHEVLMLDYAHTYKTTNTEFQRFWKYRYFVLYPEKILDSLCNRKFIEIANVESALERATVSQLKQVLAENNLKVSGKKADLIKRLIEGCTKDILEREFPERYYKLTELGKEELSENEYISYIHRHSRLNLDIWSLNLMVYSEPRYPYRDKIWGYLNKESLKHAQEGNWGLYRNTRFSMSEFLKEEKKYIAAFNLVSEVIYYDLSGLSNGSELEMDDWEKQRCLEYFFPYKSSLITIPPGIITSLQKYIELLKWDVATLENELSKQFDKISTYRHVFTKDECVKIVLAELNKDEQTLNEIYAAAKKRIEQTW